MDFTKFINSKDIRDYHRKIGYEYNSLEAAWLVSQCHSITLRERHEAWQWIIDNMPDLIVKDWISAKEENGRAKGEKISLNGKTLHEYINAYMEMQKKYIGAMKKGGRGIVYNFEFLYKDHYLGKNSEYYNAIFPSWESCIDCIKSKAEDLDIVSARVRAVTIGETEEFSRGYFVEIAPDGEINNTCMGLEEDHDGFIDLGYFFDNQWLEFPVPFRKGDVVCIDPNGWNTIGPLVLEDMNITGWENPRNQKDIKRRTGWDSSDMTLWGYYMTNSENYEGVSSDVFWTYMDAEYCDELTGMDKCLKPISSYMKDEIGIDLLLDAYYNIVTKEIRDVVNFNWYTEEGQELAGVLED